MSRIDRLTASLGLPKESRGRIPPPLTPPHKGEGNAVVVLWRKIVEAFSVLCKAKVSLPLVGRGQGWVAAYMRRFSGPGNRSEAR